MNRTSVKVIKRSDVAGAFGADGPRNSGVTKSTVVSGSAKVEEKPHSKVAATVANWISERKGNDRVREILAVRKLFSDESLLSTSG